MAYGSLRKVLIRRLSLSFGFTLLLLIPVIYHLLQRPAIDAYDHDVSDATLSLIPHLQVVAGEAKFLFPPEAEQVIRTDSYDEIYYLVLGPGRRFIAGDRNLPVPKALDFPRGSDKPLMYDATYRNRDIRVSAIQHERAGQNFLFFTAETTNKREKLAVNSAIAMTLSMLVLVAVSAITVWYNIRRALAPIENIRMALHDMLHHDLKRLDESQAPTEIRPLVQEFNALLQRLDTAAEAQQRFVASAAHQLRTPLAGVRTQLELVRDEPAGAQNTKRITQSIDAIARLSHLVHQMLALLSSVPGGREVSKNTHVDIAEVIRERSTEWVRLAARRATDLSFELDDLAVHGDALLLGEMIANLVDNALNYSPIGSIVTVRCRGDSEQVVIEVEDNGPGIPAEERELVFERFYRLANSSASGSGLGLAIVREIAGGVGGKVYIYPPPAGRGCIVRVEFPAAPTLNR